MTHILRNADRHRAPCTPITLSPQLTDSTATLCLHNQGPQIDPALLERIFDYGVCGEDSTTPGQRGQGLFVARTYMAKMGGTVTVRNEPDGVCFLLSLQRA